MRHNSKHFRLCSSNLPYHVIIFSISNGIDFRSIPLKTQRHGSPHEIRLLAVANIHFWHGLDRVIEGLRDYYAAPHQCIVRLRIAGDGVETLIAEYRRRIDAYSLAEYAEVIGPRSGAALDAEFEWCDMGIASLERHRNGMGHAHGGAIFALVDMTFATVSNAAGLYCVNAQTNISYLEPGRIGPLRGEARKIRSGRNLGTYDVRITDSDGTLVAIATVTGFMTKYPIQPKDA